MTLLQQNDLWTRFVAAAWKTKRTVDTGRTDDRIWINAGVFLTEPKIVFRVSAGAKAVSLGVTNATADLGLGLVMTPMFVDGALRIGSGVTNGKSQLVPVSFDATANRFALLVPGDQIDESEMPAFFLRKAEELLQREVPS